MLRDLTNAAHLLAHYMSELSEEAYCAGWMQELEYELWSAIVNGPREYGRLQVTDEHIAKLRQLSSAAGGWIVWDEEIEQRLLPMLDWEKQYAAWAKTKNRRPPQNNKQRKRRGSR